MGRHTDRAAEIVSTPGTITAEQGTAMFLADIMLSLAAIADALENQGREMNVRESLDAMGPSLFPGRD